jgi:hypothetical protein
MSVLTKLRWLCGCVPARYLQKYVPIWRSVVMDWRRAILHTYSHYESHRIHGSFSFEAPNRMALVYSRNRFHVRLPRFRSQQGPVALMTLNRLNYTATLKAFFFQIVIKTYVACIVHPRRSRDETSEVEALYVPALFAFRFVAHLEDFVQN